VCVYVYVCVCVCVCVKWSHKKIVGEPLSFEARLRGPGHTVQYHNSCVRYEVLCKPVIGVVKVLVVCVRFEAF
jgi:hypothetical protein